MINKSKTGTTSSVAILILAMLPIATLAQEDYSVWPLLTAEFPSTGGGGIVIRGYDPKIIDNTCVTPFTAHTPDGAVYSNIVEFETEAIAGGTLCKNGKWRAVDGSATGTTPLRVFIKDGISRRSP